MSDTPYDSLVEHIKAILKSIVGFKKMLRDFDKRADDLKKNTSKAKLLEKSIEKLINKVTARSICPGCSLIHSKSLAHERLCDTHRKSTNTWTAVLRLLVTLHKRYSAVPIIIRPITLNNGEVYVPTYEDTATRVGIQPFTVLDVECLEDLGFRTVVKQEIECVLDMPCATQPHTGS